MQFEGIVNFRDLGGYDTVGGAQVRSRTIFRSGHLGEATDADVARIDELGVRLVVDFRADGDIAVDGPDRLPDGVEHLSLPMFDRVGPDDIRSVISRRDPDEYERFFGEGRSEAMCISGAVSIATGQREAYGTMLARFAAGDVPAVLHCSAGKDRAGWGAAVVLFALGVDVETVRHDYLLSNEHRRELNESTAAALAQIGIDAELVRPLFEVRAAYFDAALGAAVDGWGSIDGYLAEGLGLHDARRDALRARCLA